MAARLHIGLLVNPLAGLGGAADVDRDRSVTLGELIDYVEATVPEETNGAQHPSNRLLGIDTALRLAYEQGWSP